MQCIKAGAWANHIRVDTQLQLSALHMAALNGHASELLLLDACGVHIAC